MWPNRNGIEGRNAKFNVIESAWNDEANVAKVKEWVGNFTIMEISRS